MYAEQEEALKQQLRCTQEVLEAAREREEEAAAAAVALQQVSHVCSSIRTYMWHICRCAAYIAPAVALEQVSYVCYIPTYICPHTTTCL